MPYTKEQLQNGKSVFYNSVREDLRNNYLNVLSGSAENDFRDSENVLVSFERIENPLQGIEKVNLDEPVTAQIYQDYVNKDELNLTTSTQNSNLPIYNRGSILNNIIDRNISELLSLNVSQDLPEDVIEGDVVTNEDPFDITRFLIEDGLKRRFRNLGEFYGRGFTLSNLKTITQQQLDTIVDGEDL